MDRLEVIGWAGTIAAGLVATIAAWMWHRALSDLLFTRQQVRSGAVRASDPPCVVARWNFATGSVRLFFAGMLIWILMPAVPPTPVHNAELLAVGTPLVFLAGVGSLLLVDLRFRSRLHRVLRIPPESNVVAMRRSRAPHGTTPALG
jgi:hypothetical protein